MTNQEAIKILKSKMDGTVDTSYEWAETVRLAINALSNQVICPSYNVDCTDCPAYKPCKVIEDIKAEIENIYPEHQSTGELTGYADAIDDILKIIDKHIGKENEE